MTTKTATTIRTRYRAPTKYERMHTLFTQLSNLGFTREQGYQLRRISMTLHRWAELECGDGNGHTSWCIERDEATGKPYMVTYPHTGPSRRTPIGDRERGALKRLALIVAERNARYAPDLVQAYQQGDPRGCALYIVRSSDVPTGASIDSCYSRGLAVCA